jgi:hypothetical protein
MLGAREGGKPAAAAHAGGGAGEQDAAAAARQHHARGFAADQEARQRTRFPDLAVHPLGGLGDAEAHVGTDVEDHHLDRRDLLLDVLEQRGHFLFVARVRPERMHQPAVLADLLDQRLQVLDETPRHAGDEAFARKTPRNGAAGGVARTDDQRGLFQAQLDCLQLVVVVGAHRAPCGPARSGPQHTPRPGARRNPRGGVRCRSRRRPPGG